MLQMLKYTPAALSLLVKMKAFSFAHNHKMQKILNTTQRPFFTSISSGGVGWEQYSLFGNTLITFTPHSSQYSHSLFHTPLSSSTGTDWVKDLAQGLLNGGATTVFTFLTQIYHAGLGYLTNILLVTSYLIVFSQSSCCLDTICPPHLDQISSVHLWTMLQVTVTSSGLTVVCYSINIFFESTSNLPVNNQKKLDSIHPIHSTNHDPNNFMTYDLCLWPHTLDRLNN